MQHTALQGDDDDRAPVETEQSQRLDADSVPGLGVSGEPLSRTELEAAFAMFGTPETAKRGESAEAPYRAEGPFDCEPANDAAAETRRMPALHARGLHIDPSAPIQFIKAVDWLVIAAAAEAAARWGAGASLAHMNIGDALPFVVSACALKAGLWLTDAYDADPGAVRADRALGGLTLGAFIAILCANALAPSARGAGALSAVLPVAAMALAGFHAALGVWTRAAHKNGVFAETIVLIGATAAAARFAARAAKSGDARVIAIADDRLQRAPFAIGTIAVGGDIDALLAWPGLPHVDRIVIAVTPNAEARVRDLIARLKTLPNQVDLLMDYEAKGVQGRGADRLAGAAVACISGRHRNAGRAALKRAQDVVIGGALLVLLALPMLAIALAVKFDGEGPVLHRQRRHGFNNCVFTALKFRTMQRGVRVTRVGAYLRRTGLDNLPQLINVLRGEMSLVGPRPHDVGLQIANRDLTDVIAEYAHRHRVKPGITGWAQLNGACGQPQAAACVRKCVRLDLEYIARASLLFDLRILARTAIAPFLKHGRS
ncbi:MAG: sugar transferase [Proteobacteria bacterium]|nr:sugar transferase [Pseudomonadota bacterium]